MTTIQQSIFKPCEHHASNLITTILLTQDVPTQPSNCSNPIIRSKPLQFSCQDCLISIPHQYRSGISSISIKDLNSYFRSLENPNHEAFVDSQDTDTSNSSSIVNQEQEPNIFLPIVDLYKEIYHISNEYYIDQESFFSGLKKLIKPYKQPMILKKRESLVLGTADFSFECCAYVPSLRLLFIGNRAGELFVINRDTRSVVKKIICPERVGAVKYIAERDTVVVTGLNKYILKVDPHTLEVVHQVSNGSSEYRNYIVIEYLPNRDLLLVGGFNMDNSVELYNFSDLSLQQAMVFPIPGRLRPDELWASVYIQEEGTLLLGYKTGLLQVWDANRMKLRQSLYTGDNIYALEYQKDLKLLYLGQINGVIQVWKLKKSGFEKVRVLNTGAFAINKIRFLHGAYSKYMLISNYSRNLEVRNFSLQKIDELNIFDMPSRSVFVLDNKTILSVGETPGVVYFMEATRSGKGARASNAVRNNSKAPTMQEGDHQSTQICLI